MSRLDEWMKNIFGIFSFHEKALPPAQIEKPAAEKQKEGGGRGESGGGYRIDPKAAPPVGAPNPFKTGGGM
jgi:hypothetical protein